MRAILPVIALLLTCFWMSFSRGIAFIGEGWMVQVIRRVAAGEVLYQDVAYGAGPLPVYLAAFAAGWFGSHILLLKGLVACFYAGALALGLEVLKAAGASRSFRVAYVALAIIVAPTPLSPLYQPASTAALTGCCLALTLAATGSLSVMRAAIVAGTLAGLNIATKQNVGVYALIAVIAVLFFLSSGRWYRDVLPGARAALTALAASACTAGLCLIPHIGSGSLEGMLEHTLANKRTYVTLGAIAYSQGLTDCVSIARQIRSVASLLEFCEQFSFVLAPLSVLAPLAAAWITGSHRKPVFRPIVAFSLAAFAAVFPRADLIHVQYAMPMLLVSLIWGGSEVYSLLNQSESRRSWGATFLAGAILLLAASSLTLPLVRFARGQVVPCQLPGFEGPLVSAQRHQRLQKLLRTLQTALPSGDTFFLSPRAGYWYISTGRRNPTPYDFPYRTMLGEKGAERLLQAVKQDNVLVVVEHMRAPLYPYELEQQIRRQLRHLCTIGPLHVYTRPASTGP